MYQGCGVYRTLKLKFDKEIIIKGQIKIKTVKITNSLLP